MKYFLVDNKIREIEFKKLEEFGKVVKLPKINTVYEEISGHADISFCALKNNLVVAKEREKFINELFEKENILEINVIYGENVLKENYPFDIKFNVCIVGNYAIHNFEYTDKKLKEMLVKNGYELIDIKQGYTNCSIAIIDDNSIITCDKGIYNALKNTNLNILYLDYIPYIKLIKRDAYSKMDGFIGGAISKINDNKVVVFGELDKIDKNNQIRKFIEERKIEIIDFKGLDVIDYGGMIVI